MNEIMTMEQAERRKVLWSIFAILVIFALIIVNEWIFRNWLNADYIQWYIDNGVFISLGFSFLSLSYDLDEFIDIISTDPLSYFGVYLSLIGGVLFAWSGPLLNQKPRKNELSGFMSGKIISFFQLISYNFDAAIAGIFSIMFLLVIIAWLLVVAPVQYFVYLVAGAYPRIMLRSKKKIVYRIMDNGNFRPLEIGKNEKAPVGATDVGFFHKPVTLTSSVAAVLLWTLSQVI